MKTSAYRLVKKRQAFHLLCRPVTNKGGTFYGICRKTYSASQRERTDTGAVSLTIECVKTIRFQMGKRAGRTRGRKACGTEQGIRRYRGLSVKTVGNRRTVGQDRPVGTAAETDDGQGTKTFPDFQKYPVFACRISGIFRVIFCRALLLFLPRMGTMGKTRSVC